MTYWQSIGPLVTSSSKIQPGGFILATSGIAGDGDFDDGIREFLFILLGDRFIASLLLYTFTMLYQPVLLILFYTNECQGISNISFIVYIRSFTNIHSVKKDIIQMFNWSYK